MCFGGTRRGCWAWRHEADGLWREAFAPELVPYGEKTQLSFEHWEIGDLLKVVGGRIQPKW